MVGRERKGRGGDAGGSLCAGGRSDPKAALLLSCVHLFIIIDTTIERRKSSQEKIFARLFLADVNHEILSRTEGSE